MASRKLIYSIIAHEQLGEWVKQNPKVAIKIMELVQEISKTPFTGKGKPEPLKHQLKGTWSRRIDHEHRLVYVVSEIAIDIVSCKNHYI